MKDTQSTVNAPTIAHLLFAFVNQFHFIRHVMTQADAYFQMATSIAAVVATIRTGIEVVGVAIVEEPINDSRCTGAVECEFSNTIHSNDAVPPNEGPAKEVVRNLD